MDFAERNGVVLKKFFANVKRYDETLDYYDISFYKQSDDGKTLIAGPVERCIKLNGLKDYLKIQSHLNNFYIVEIYQSTIYLSDLIVIVKDIERK